MGSSRSSALRTLVLARRIAAVAAACVLVSSMLVIADIQSAAAATCESDSRPSYSVEVCFVQPVGGALSGDATISASVTISGSSTGVAKLAFSLDGNYLLTDYSAPYTFKLPTAKFVDGPKTISVSAKMRDGFVSSPASIDVSFANGNATNPVNTNTFTPTTGRPAAPGTPFVVVATGDGASGEPGAAAVTNQIVGSNPNLFLYLGDVYEKGTITEFRNWYGDSSSYYGRLKSITNPIVGNHEYENGVAPGYFDYWDNVPDYYSYNAGGWHFVALNSNSQLGQLDPGQPQYEWLRQDLAANDLPCTAVYFHHPRYNIGAQGDSPRLTAAWSLMAASGVDVVLAGHDHNYQRWTPLDGNGSPSPSGITEFVAGSGGHGTTSFIRSDSRVAASNNTTLGSLQLALGATSAAFSYVTSTGAVLDSGTVMCSGSPADTEAPSAPGNLTATGATASTVDLSWAASSDNVGVKNYVVSRNGVDVATVPAAALSYTDSGLVPDHSYQYRAFAVDVADNRSVSSNLVTATTGHPAQDLTVNPDADTYVDDSKPTITAGSNPSIRVDATPTQRTYLRLTVTGFTQPITAKLRIYANSGSSVGYQVHPGTDNTWSETTMTNNTAAAYNTTTFTNSGPITANTWTEVDVSPYITTNGTYTLVLTGTSNTGINLASRESPNQPQLVIATSTANTAPTATADSYTVAQDQQLSVPAPGVLANDNDPDGDALVALKKSEPSHGSVMLNAEGGFTYAPAAGYSGGDSFTYAAGDFNSESNPTTVSITVTAVAPPTGVVLEADTYVDDSKPTITAGSNPSIRVDATPTQRTYLRLTVTGFTQPITAKLRIYANSGSSVGYQVHPGTDNTWSETTMTNNTAAAYNTTTFTNSGPITANTWTEVDVSPYITTNGTYTLVLTGTSNTGINLASRESPNQPQLVITS